jgi:hypothetical protein
MSLELTKSEEDPNLYYKVFDGDPLILVLYVNEYVPYKEHRDSSIKCKRELASEFKMRDIVLMHYFLGLEVWKDQVRYSLDKGSTQLRS